MQFQRPDGALGIFWLRKILLHTISQQTVAQPGEWWTYKLVQRPGRVEGTRVWVLVPQEMERIDLYG